MNTKGELRRIRLEISEEVLANVFEECDRHDRDETGGRVVGHFTEKAGTLIVRATGVIEPGPNARRSRTSFFQDGEYQTRVFRKLEEIDPSIEHLGNWHTHHVNGYPTLSAGDKATYRRIVNHELHNLDFFYALLVTQRNDGGTGLDRYHVRHYVLFRGEDAVHEVQRQNVRVLAEPEIVANAAKASGGLPGARDSETCGSVGSLEVRARDEGILKVLCPSMEPRLSRQTGTFFWKGETHLIDGSEAEVRVVEVKGDKGLGYHLVLADGSADIGALCEVPFPSAAEAVRALESELNRQLYESVKRGRTRWPRWRKLRRKAWKS